MIDTSSAEEVWLLEQLLATLPIDAQNYYLRKLSAPEEPR